MKQYVDVVSGYVMAKMVQTCPAMFEIDLAIQAIKSIHPEFAEAKKLHPQIYNVVNQYPIFMDPSRTVFLDFERLGTNIDSWNFKFTSKLEGTGETMHMSGQLYFQPPDNSRSYVEFSRFERLVTYERCLRVLESSDDAEEVIQGRSIYKVFSDIIDYGDKFKGLQKLVGRPNESAARVVRKRSGKSWLDFALGETFTQVGGI